MYVAVGVGISVGVDDWCAYPAAQVTEEQGAPTTDGGETAFQFGANAPVLLLLCERVRQKRWCVVCLRGFRELYRRCWVEQ